MECGGALANGVPEADVISRMTSASDRLSVASVERDLMECQPEGDGMAASFHHDNMVLDY